MGGWKDVWEIQEWYRLYWGLRSTAVRKFILLLLLLLNWLNIQPIIWPLEHTTVYKTYRIT